MCDCDASSWIARSLEMLTCKPHTKHPHVCATYIWSGLIFCGLFAVMPGAPCRSLYMSRLQCLALLAMGSPPILPLSSKK